MKHSFVAALLAVALVAVPTAADAEPTYGGHTAAEWAQIAEILRDESPAPVPTTDQYGPGYGSGTDMPSYAWAPEVEAAVVNAAIRFNVDLKVLAEIIRCESNGNPAARNPSSGAAGLGQHLPRYFAFRAEMAGHPGGDPFDPVVNADATAWLLATDGTAPWSPWSGACSRWY